MPSASVVVATAGRPSGIAATASEMALRSIGIEGLAAEHAEPEHGAANQAVDDDELAPDVAELALDRCLGRPHGAEQCLDAADLGRGAGRGDQRRAGAAGHRCSAEHHVAAIRECRSRAAAAM